MDCSNLHATEEKGLKAQDIPFYFEGCSDSESELEFSFNSRDDCSKKTPKITRAQSPVLVLAFPFSTAGGPPDCCQSSASDLDSSQDEDHRLSSCDEPIEEWMILGGAEQRGDQSIQLHIGYWSGCSSDEDSENDVRCLESDDTSWAVMEKDKSGPHHPLQRYYSASQRSLTCRNCNRTGHLARVCPIRKRRPTCSLCGLQGHRPRACPNRHCPSCGLPPHGHAPCPQRPLWDQHCLRCGMTGHLADACPDTWRQYHSTVRAEAPLQLETNHSPKDIQHHVYCYNCSLRGHYGYECAGKRITNGTFTTLPFVCRYDTVDGESKPSARMQRRAQELRETFLLPSSDRRHRRTLRRLGERPYRPAQCGAGTRRRDPPRGQPREGKRVKAERQWQRQELKKLRRQAQARRGGGLYEAGVLDDEGASLLEHVRNPRNQRHRGPPAQPPLKRSRRAEDEEGCSGKATEGTRSRKSREAERWKKRRGMRRGFLHPHGNLKATDENLLSPKNQTRHRKR